MHQLRYLISVYLLILPMLVLGNDLELEQLYKTQGIDGAIVISSLDGKTEYSYNPQRLAKRYLPASTFKITNTLIALEEGVISEQELIKWDGRDKGWAPWNQDQTLKSAFSLSCVWCYQELAKRIGLAKYQQYLKAINYGNQQTGRDVTTFWLEGDLKISAREQLEFLKKLYTEKLQFKQHDIQLLKEIMIVEQSPSYVLRAKTGMAIRIKEQHGWYVGYFEINDQVWFFANNISIKNKSDAKLRKKLVMESFRIKGLI